ncbi:efflux RND transporter permease subunit [Halioxenophilus sp. WMMB6]|uniref:efflux RND transporter permease subunit n=1 Tax=Halioxenophilus sp. WMMB6 TaxID=3073815 RepID=UPI00295ED348|nr:efflux RND transporter permease subunit [Halioxenophilus sp. WMMB6]
MSDSDKPVVDEEPIEIPEEEVSSTDTRTGLIGFFAYNPVAANLLMFFILVMGLVTYFTIQRQMFPNFELNYIQIQATYPGASPKEIEEGILVKIEEKLKDVTEIDKTVSRAFRNSGRVTLEVDPDADLAEVLDKVKLRVDGIATFPAGMEPLVIYQEEFRQEIIEMGLTGDLPLYKLKPLAKQLEDELLALGNVSLVDLYAPDDEIAVEVHPEVLRQYNLTINDVANAINRYSTNLSAGQLRSDSGIISVRVENQYYHGDEFNQIPVKIGDGGAKVLLGDIATVRDNFVEGEHYFKYSGKNAIYISVKATNEQNMVPVAETVNQWVQARNKTLPHGLELKVLVDMTYYLNGRLDMMLKNLLMGAVLVAVLLTVFLRFNVAMWVMAGLPVCFLGAVMLMPLFDVTINVVSLFGFIMVLGIVVDDAIVIGESVYTEVEKNGGGTRNVVVGARRVATPATFGVLTTIAVFAPFTLSSGPDGTFFTNIAMIVMACLFFSLVESKLILPAHLAKIDFAKKKESGWRSRFNRRYTHFINHHYRGFVTLCTEWRWLVLCVFVGLLVLSVSMVTANLVRFIPSPAVPHDFPSIKIEMNENVADRQVIDALVAIEKVVRSVDQKMIDQYGRGMVKDILTFNTSRNEGQLLIALVDEDQRQFTAFDLSRLWREQLPDIPGLKSINIYDDVNSNQGGDGELGYLLYGSDLETLNAAGRLFMDLLRQQTGIFDVSSTIDPVSKEIQLRLLPVAYDLGLSLADIASQVGLSFYGDEAQRVIRDGDEIKVMVRYPELTRKTFSSLKYALIKTPAGGEVMLGDVVQLIEKPGISYIRRENGFRSVYIWGAIDEQVIEPSAVEKLIKETLLPQVFAQYPSVRTKLGGSLEDQKDQANEQILFFIAGLIVVYMLLAIPLRSYSHPFIIMSVIPFSLTGAIWGHFALGMDLSMMSTFGLIAAAGVVINDSLVMTDYTNQLRKMGVHTLRAVVDAGCARFRAITLTSITTFAGVMPILFETSLQARFVIPMAVSLGCAVLYATLVTLLLVPCLYLIFEDIGAAIKQFYGWIVRLITATFGRSASS